MGHPGHRLIANVHFSSLGCFSLTCSCFQFILMNLDEFPLLSSSWLYWSCKKTMTRNCSFDPKQIATFPWVLIFSSSFVPLSMPASTLFIQIGVPHEFCQWLILLFQFLQFCCVHFMWFSFLFLSTMSSNKSLSRSFSTDIKNYYVIGRVKSNVFHKNLLLFDLVLKLFFWLFNLNVWNWELQKLQNNIFNGSFSSKLIQEFFPAFLPIRHVI